MKAVIRGGRWDNGANAGVFAFNANNGPSNSNDNVGFRCGSGVQAGFRAFTEARPPSGGVWKRHFLGVSRGRPPSKDVRRRHFRAFWRGRRAARASGPGRRVGFRRLLPPYGRSAPSRRRGEKRSTPATPSSPCLLAGTNGEAGRFGRAMEVF